MKKIISCILFLVLSVFISGYSGCATFQQKSKIKFYEDKFDKTKTWELTNNILSNKDWVDGTFSFGLRKFSQGEDTVYLIMLYYVSYSSYNDYASKSSEWFFIENGESLVLLVDGKRMGFSGDGSLEHRQVGDGYVSETAFYKITKKQIEKIATASAISVKIIGQQFYTNADFTIDNISNVMKFYNECVLGIKTESNNEE